MSLAETTGPVSALDPVALVAPKSVLATEFEAGVSRSARAAGTSEPATHSKIIRDDHVTEHITSDNPQIHTRAPTKAGLVSLVRSGRKARARVVVRRVAARVTVTQWFKSQRKTRKSARSKSLKQSSNWTLRLRKRAIKARVSAPKFKSVSFRVSTKPTARNYKLAVRKTGAVVPNSAKDYTRMWDGKSTKPVWDTCKYSRDESGNVSKMTSAREFTYGGLGDVRSSYRTDIKAALGKVAAATGYRFKEVSNTFKYRDDSHPYNHIQFSIVDKVRKGSGWSMSGYAGPAWASAGTASKQQWKLYLGGIAHMVLQSNAPATARQLLAMHEVSHVMGLGHAKGDYQVMHPTIMRTKTTWGAGDKNGLNEVGFGGCRFKVGDPHIWYASEFDLS